MANNPDPQRITEEMWQLWDARPNFSWRLGGFYADKKGYHNTVNANLKRWPNTYSIRVALDLVKENRDKVRAVDLTMSDAEMVKWTTNMRNAAFDPVDPRLNAVREFYGTLDNKTVFGLIKDSLDGRWEVSTADTTHLWHGHTSIFTAFVNDWDMLAPLLSVWAGESLIEWKVASMLVQLGDTGDEVKYWQLVHNTVRESVTPAAPAIDVDGIYGEATSKAFAAFVKSGGGQSGFSGNALTPWLALRYQRAFAIDAVKDTVPATAVIDTEILKTMVNVWLTENIPASLSLDATVNGRLSL